MDEEKTEELFDDSKKDSLEKQEEGKPSKAEFYIELALFLVLGLLIGIAAKTEAVKRVAIGFDDYKMKIYQSEYNINSMQVEQAKKRAEEVKKQQEAQSAESGQGQTQGAETSTPAETAPAQGN